MAEEYLHKEPGDTIESIAGHYTMEKEFTLECNGRDALVILGHMIIDRSCCGMGGCRYALVPGFIIGPSITASSDGRRRTLVEPVENEADKDALSTKINAAELVQQIIFS